MRPMASAPVGAAPSSRVKGWPRTASPAEGRCGTGVLLVHLGTPDQPAAPGKRRDLKEFLSDRRVVELPRLLWMLVLRLFILPFRPYKLVHAYRKVWTPRGSPLMAISRDQQAALAEGSSGSLSELAPLPQQ